VSQPVSFVTELYEPSVGGQENRFARFAEAFAARGRDVTVYTTDHTGGTLPAESVVNGVHVVRYISLRGYVQNGSRGLAPLARYCRATHRLLARLLSEPGPVWVNEMPVVHMVRTPDAPGLVVDWCEYPTYWKVNAFARRLLRRASRGTAVAQAVADHLQAVRADVTIDVVRSPVPAPSGPAPDREMGTIVYVGRIVGHKNIGALAEAMRRYNGNGGPHGRLLIAGDGPDRPALEREYGGSDGIQFLGVVTGSEKRRLIRSSWLLAVPGSREGFPTVAAEANVYGTPLLASGSSRNSTGEFIRANDVGVIARGVRPSDFLEAIRSVDDRSWDRWNDRSTQLGGLYDPELNTRRLEATLDRGTI
jgi:glycosyltransferase involved in cell wall biosynthesis